MFYSPLRYPGGKNKIAPFIAYLCKQNNITEHYVEPYAGGASVGLWLLMEGFINRITINDKDRSIYAFWYAVLFHSEELCKLIEETEITIENWHLQKKIQKEKETADLLILGFSTFFLNRTNRSGIISAGAIGGINQNTEYTLGCRFNKKDLIQRIKEIATNKSRITLYNVDAIELIDLIKKEKGRNTLIYLDPPYYYKANSLYMSHYKNRDHKLVSDKIKSIRKFKWVVSYDNTIEINALYCNYRKNEYSFVHTAYKSKEGKEILFFCQSMIIPNIEKWNPVYFQFNKKRKTFSYKERKKVE